MVETARSFVRPSLIVMNGLHAERNGRRNKENQIIIGYNFCEFIETAFAAVKELVAIIA